MEANIQIRIKKVKFKEVRKLRLRIELELKNEKISIDYRPIVISLFKHILTVYESGKYFNTYYEIGKTKPFSFAVEMPNSIFEKESILVPNKKITITFSTDDRATGIVFFNAFLTQKNKHYPMTFENEMTLRNISLEKEFVITTNTIDVVFRSPLCVREHFKDKNKDIYYSCGKEGFDEALDKVLALQITHNKDVVTLGLKDFSIVPIQCKKTVVRHHSQLVEVTVGSFRLTGSIALLDYFYSSGIASRRSSGFGLFDIIK